MNRIATFKSGKNPIAVIIEIGGKALQIPHADLAPFDTPGTIELELYRQASLNNVQPPRLFAHINRDGSLALATGNAPNTWPEDEKEPK